MSRLGDLYKAMETLRKEGLSLNEDLERQVSELEENIIKKEILPIVTETIERALKQVERELVLVVDYHPGLPISVSLSRKTNITELIEAKRLEADPEVNHKEFGPRKNKRTQIAPRTGLCIYRKDGSIIQERDAATTFTSAIMEAGLMRVRELNVRFCGINVVSTTKDKKYGNTQREAAPGLFVLTHSSTKDKKKMLDTIISFGDYGQKKDSQYTGIIPTCKYIARRLFVPLDVVKVSYPTAYKHKILLPFLPVFRIIKKNVLFHLHINILFNGIIIIVFIW